jgi:ADP-ribosylglycohydrolase
MSTATETPEHLVLGIEAAVRVGYDTDTVAAIAGGLLGARWGYSAIPKQWLEPLHGWPGYKADDLVKLADQITEPIWL